MTEPRAGRFIVLDGPEGAGKSTQVDRLVRSLRARGRQATAVRDPGSTPVSERIREVLLDPALPDMDVRTELFLYMASRAEMVARIIRPALDVGLAVVCDRFVSSTVVYQGYAGGLEPDLVREVGRIACDGLEPDLTIVLDVDVATGFARLGGEHDRMEGKGPAFHEQVRRGFLELARAEPERVVVVDASRGADEVARDVEEAAARVL